MSLKTILGCFKKKNNKYNKQIVWADTRFHIDAERLCWIKDDGTDDPDDFCLHGQVIVKIGEETLEYHSTVSAAGLYLLRTLSDNHIIHHDQAMIPCCGHWMRANDDLTAVDIGGCPNGVDWSVIHDNDKVRLITDTGKETFIAIDDYREKILIFVNKVEAFYKNSAKKNLSETDDFSRNGYIAFWNEWNRLRMQWE